MKQYPQLVQQLLRSRGITTAKEAEQFFARRYTLQDPLKIHGMAQAMDRVNHAIKGGERIMVHGDYDADGVCASGLMHAFFSAIGYTNFYIVIPNRCDGYGISTEAINSAKENGVSLIITVDCGITAVKETALANELGVDVVITDHHLPPDGGRADLPKACAIINPHNLCGTGVAFMLVSAILENGDYSIVQGWEKWLLDFVAIATIADVMPLTGENRILVYYGLQVLAKTRSLGLRLLCERLKLNLAYITEDDVSFMVAPALNIAGRMDHADIAFTLLTTHDYEIASDTVNHILSLKALRKQEVSKIIGMISREDVLGDVIVVGDESWHTGVLGLIAARLAEKYNKPAFVWGRGGVGSTASQGVIRGSARSNGSVNLQELVQCAPKNIFEEFGGHKMAAGFSLKPGDGARLRSSLNKAYKKVKVAPNTEGMKADAVVPVTDISWEFFDMINQFAPFGAENPKPLFAFNGLLVSESSYFGKMKEHLKLRFGNSVYAIAFFANGEWRHSSGDVVDVLGSLEKNVFRNKQELRIRINDVRLSS